MVGHKTEGEEFYFPPIIFWCVPIESLRRAFRSWLLDFYWGEILLKVGEEDRIILGIKEDLTFSHAAVVKVIVAIFGVTFKSVSSRHDQSLS